MRKRLYYIPPISWVVIVLEWITHKNSDLIQIDNNIKVIIGNIVLLIPLVIIYAVKALELV